MTPGAYLTAARVPESLRPQRFGLWSVEREQAPPGALWIGWPTITLLRRTTMATLHQGGGEVVMEDSRRELLRHMPIWLAARGRVLVTGLGLGCVVRGLLASPRVEHVDVVEVDAGILRVIGREFESNPRVDVHLGDALTWRPPKGTRWDFAWHDCWTDTAEGEPHLQVLHGRLMLRYRARVSAQGAWMFPRTAKRLMAAVIG